MRGRVLVVPCLFGALAWGCAGQSQADEVFQETEQAITEQHTLAIRFAPEAFSRVMAVYDSARRHYAAGDYGQAIAVAERSLVLTRELPAAIGAGRRAMTERWQTVSEEIDVLLDSLEERVNDLARTQRLPSGIAATDVARAREVLPGFRETLAESHTTFREGKLSEALHVATQLRDQAAAVAASLDLAGSDRSEP